MEDDLRLLFDPTTERAFQAARRTSEGWFLRAQAFDETHLALHHYRKEFLSESQPIYGVLIHQSSLQRGEMLAVCCSIECYMKGLAINASTCDSEIDEVINAGHKLSTLAEILAARGINEFLERYESRFAELTVLRQSALIYPAPKLQKYNEAHSEVEYNVTITGDDLRIIADLRRRVSGIRGLKE